MVNLSNCLFHFSTVFIFILCCSTIAYSQSAFSAVFSTKHKVTLRLLQEFRLTLSDTVSHIWIFRLILEQCKDLKRSYFLCVKESLKIHSRIVMSHLPRPWLWLRRLVTMPGKELCRNGRLALPPEKKKQCLKRRSTTRHG